MISKLSPQDMCPIERAEDIEASISLLRGFASAVEDGDSDFPDDILDGLKWAAAVLWVTSGRVGEGRSPRIYEVMTSPKGVSFNAIAKMIPPFCNEMEECIERRRISALPQREAAVTSTPAPDDLF